MRKSFFTIAITFLLSFVSVSAETLKPTSWSSYGVSFLAPADIIVDDDSEEGYTISNPNITINVQLLNGEGLKRQSSRAAYNISQTKTTSLSNQT